MEEQRINRTRRHKCCALTDVQMIPSKVAFFMCYLSYGSLVFSNIFLISVGLTASEAGFILGMSRVAAFCASPIWAGIADYTGYRRLLFFTAALGTALAEFSLPWVAMIVEPTALLANQKIMINDGTQHMLNTTSLHESRNRCLRNFTGSLRGKAAVTIFNGTDCNRLLVPFSSTLFCWMLVLSMFSDAFRSPITGFIDSIVTKVIEESETTETYGKQYMFGSLGYGISGLVTGILADKFCHAKLSKYSVAYFTYLPLTLLVIPLVFILLKQGNWESASNNVQGQPKKRSMLKVLVETVIKVDYMFIIFSVLVVGVIRTVHVSFLFLIMKDEMNASATAMGFAQLMNYLVEFFIFPFTANLMKMVGGSIICIEVGMLSWVVRVVMISYITNAWLVILPQVLQCVSFALFWAAIISYTQKIVSREIYMTMFQIINSIFYKASGIIANMAGGVLYNYYKGPALYRGCAVIGGVWLIVMFLFFHGRTFIKKKSRGREEIVLDSMTLSVADGNI